MQREQVLIEVGARVREHRKVHGWSQEVLAERSGVARLYISQIETGSRNLSVIYLLLLAKALDVEASQLLPDLRNADQ